MGQYDRFPIDVWMRRAMAELYDIDKTDDTAMQKIAEEEYGLMAAGNKTPDVAIRLNWLKVIKEDLI